MDLRINKEISIDMWTRDVPAPYWIFLHVGDSQRSLTIYECKCLIAALEEIIREHIKCENK